MVCLIENPLFQATAGYLRHDIKIGAGLFFWHTDLSKVEEM